MPRSLLMGKMPNTLAGQINDIVALTQADVGVSMGTGASAALTSSDFCLLSSNLLSVLTLLSLAKATYNKSEHSPHSRKPQN